MSAADPMIVMVERLMVGNPLIVALLVFAVAMLWRRLEARDQQSGADRAASDARFDRMHVETLDALKSVSTALADLRSALDRGERR